MGLLAYKKRAPDNSWEALFQLKRVDWHRACETPIRHSFAWNFLDVADQLFQLIDTIGLDETSHRMVVRNSGGNALMLLLYDPIPYFRYGPLPIQGNNVDIHMYIRILHH